MELIEPTTNILQFIVRQHLVFELFVNPPPGCVQRGGFLCGGGRDRPQFAYNKQG